MATAKTLRNLKCPLKVKGEVVYVDAMRFCSSIETEESHAITIETFFFPALWIEPGACHMHAVYHGALSSESHCISQANFELTLKPTQVLSLWSSYLNLPNSKVCPFRLCFEKKKYSTLSKRNGTESKEQTMAILWNSREFTTNFN